MSNEHPFPDQVNLELGLDQPDDEASLRRLCARQLGVDTDALPALTVRKRSLDCRRGRVRFHYLIGLSEAPEEPLGLPHPKSVSQARKVVIVGDGPAGMFCAYQLARSGVGAVVVDRGKPVQPRRKDLKGLTRRGTVDPDSNYCFGEGGAGTYSDGKLYTRSHKRGPVRDVLEILALHGAPPSILVEARPHIGSNKLPGVVTAIRERLEEVGVEFRFGVRVSGLSCVPSQGRQRVDGVLLADGQKLEAERVVIATGHSAWDVYQFLLEAGASLEPKPFALGVRIEHPQPLINQIQYGKAAGHPRLPSAAYSLTDSPQPTDARAVFSFCMCPGGFIVPAATVPGQLVVNGMSLSRRDSRYANSGLVVEIPLAELERAGFKGELMGTAFQRQVECAAFAAGGDMLQAPATRVTDFLEGRASSTVPDSSYVPGLTATDVGSVLDCTTLPVANRIREALKRFDRKLKGYVTSEAVCVGVESRTSAPVRVRRAEDFSSPEIFGLYPCGEGAGYAGGIVSAALDGMRVGRAICEQLGVTPA